MTVAARRSSIVARSSAARRFAVVERLRRALFSPSKLLTVGALALALSAQSAFAQGTSTITPLPGKTVGTGMLPPGHYRIDDTIDDGGKTIEGELDLSGLFHGNMSYANSSIILNGNSITYSPNNVLKCFTTYADDTSKTYTNWNCNGIPSFTDVEQQLYARFFGFDALDIDRYNEAMGVYIDATQGGLIEINNIGTNDVFLHIAPQKISGKFRKSGTGQLIIQSAVSELFVDTNGNDTWDEGEEAVLDANGNIPKKFFDDANGNGTLDPGESLVLGKDGKLAQKITYSGKTEFEDTLVVDGGQLSVFGDADYKKSVEASGGAFYADYGNHNFNGDILSAGRRTESGMISGDVTLVGAEDKPINVNQNVNVAIGGNLWSFGNVNYDGNIVIQNYRLDKNGSYVDRDDKAFRPFYALAVFTQDLGTGRPTFGDNSQVVIDGVIPDDNMFALYPKEEKEGKRESNAVVYANANCFDVDVLLKNSGVLTYTNVDTNPKDKSINNQFYVTLDEKQTPTVLKWTAGSANIAKALENNNLITRNLTSDSANAQLYLTAAGIQTANSLGEANGYTVVFNNAEGKKFDYAGMTLVDNAFMVVQGDTNFGAKNAGYDPKTATGGSDFRVFGEAYLKTDVAGKEAWNVQGSGMLGFDRDNASATSAPSITADIVQFNSGYVSCLAQDLNASYTASYNKLWAKHIDEGGQDTVEEQKRISQEALKENVHINGSRIWLDTTFNGQYASPNNKTVKLGAINANQIIFDSDTQIWYDGISTKQSGDKMTFDLNAPTIGYKKVSDELTMVYQESTSESGEDTSFYEIDRAADNTKIATVGEIEDLFGRAVLVDAKYELAAAPANGATALTEEGRRAQTATAGTVTVTAKSVGQYAEGQNMSAKERELAGKIDEARVQGGRSTGFYDALYNETDERNVRQTIHNLSLLGYTMLNSQGHFGNPTSSFFGGASISGEAKRGQERQEDWETEENQPEQKSEIAKEQNDYNPTRGLWAAYTHTSVDGEDYKFGGVTTHGYKLRRDGIIGGIRRQIDATTSAGLFFGISMPEVASSARLDAGNQIAGNGYGVVSSSMEMTDFQYAVHFEKVFADAWELAAYVGGGTQAMEWERRADLRDSHSGIYKYKADGSGSTFTGTLYLSYRADVNDALTLRPTIGVDTEHSWLYGFEEKGGLEGSNPGNVALNPYTDMFAQAYRYKKTYYARNTARVGLSLAYSNPRNDMLGANARVFYGVKLGGDDAPELTYYNENYRWENMASHEMGDGSLNVGGGGFMHLNPIKTLTATGDVNAIWYKNAQTFNVTGGVSYRF